MSAWSLLAGLMFGMAAPHPLVAAAERLHEQGLGDACGALVAYATDDPGLTDPDRARLHRIPCGGTASSPRPLIRSMVEVRDPALRSLLGAVDALFQRGQFTGAQEVLAMARDLETSDQADLVQVLLRQGLMAMPAEPEARLAFRDALMMDRNAALPDYVEQKAKAVLESVRQALPPPSLRIDITYEPPPPPPPPDRRLGLITSAGGLTLLVNGAAASLVAIGAMQNQAISTENGDMAGWQRSRDTASNAKWAAGGLLGAGAVALGVGAVLYFSPQAGVRIGGAAGPGQGAITVGGSF